MMEELISFLPHTEPTFEADNAKVYAPLCASLSSTSVMSSISRFQRTRKNGRDAYFDLVTHNMGSSKWEMTVEKQNFFSHESMEWEVCSISNQDTHL